MSKESHTWAIRPQDQGQIVAYMYPQLSGSPEGNEGTAKGLRLVYDSADGAWELYADAKLAKKIASGNRFDGQSQPTVAKAMQLAGR
jgi:hypothetical protein